MSIDNFQLFKYRRPLVEKTEKHNTTKGESYVENTKIVVPLKYLNNFWRSLDMPLVNCKVHLQLTGYKTAFYQVLETMQNLK